MKFLTKDNISHTSYAFFNVTLISVVTIPYIRSLGYDALQLSTSQTVQQIAWFTFLFISGIIFDLFGAKITFIIGRLLEIISILLLLRTDFYSILLAMLFVGLGRGVMYGKYTSYIYNLLSTQGKINIYPRVASAYYFMWDISLAIMSFFSALILKKSTYETLIYISLFLKLISLIFIAIFIPSNKQNPSMLEFRSPSIGSIFTSVYECMKKNSTFTFLLLFYGVLNFFTYPLCLTIADMILADKGWNASMISKYTGSVTAAMAIGTAIPIFLFKKGISIRSCMILSILEMIFMLFAGFTYNTTAFVLIAGFICCSLSIIEVSIERRFEEFSNKKIRGSALSVSIAIGNLFTIVNLMLIGWIAKHYSYQIGLIVISIQILVCLALLFIKLGKLK